MPQKTAIPTSHSAMEEFDTCPYKYYRKRIAHDVDDPPGQAAIWGTEVHAALEEGINTGAPLTGTFASYDKWRQMVADLKGVKHPELKMGMNVEASSTGFFAPDVWFRGVADVVIEDSHSHHGIIDWKTGKCYEGPAQRQAERMAVLDFIRSPEVQDISVRFVYVKLNKVLPFEFNRNDLPDMLTRLASKARQMEDAVQSGTFPKIQNHLCRNWCPVLDCEFNGRS